MEQVLSRRLNRWSDEPVLNANGNAIALREYDLQPQDVQCLQLLTRFRYLRTSHFPELIGGNAKYRQHRLNLLARKPNKYLNRPFAQRRAYDANYQDQIYELTKRGEAVLRNRDIAIPEHRLGDEKLFEHSLMINDALASLTIGVRPGRIIWWDELCRHPRFPVDAARKLQVQICHTFERGRTATATFNYHNDSGGIFAIDMPGQPYRFFSFEAEHTNRVTSKSSLQQASFLRKFLAIQFITENGLHRKQFGIPHLTHLIVTPTQARIESMKKLVLDITGGRGVPYILFRCTPIGVHAADAPRRPEIYSEPWERAGYPAISIGDSKATLGSARPRP
jgi:hypothetical protein